MHIPSFIYLYNGGKTESLNLNEISSYLKNIFKKSEIQIRDDIITCYPYNFSSEKKGKVIDNLAELMAKIKVRGIEIKDTAIEPLPGEVEYEKSIITNPEKKSFGILYDGFSLISLYSEMISKDESNLDHCHIIFTNQLFGTWDERDLRYHARVTVYGFPSIISTTGIVEAPAKPREFYLKKQLGIDVYTLKEEFKGRFIDYDDARMTEVLKGYVLQAVFYHITGNPFCEDKNCRLYNAHWQEEVIEAQLNVNNEFCKKHKEIINQLTREAGM
jgi:hypothetical protein